MESLRKKLSSLLLGVQGVEVRGRKEVMITGLANHSRRVSPGNLFFAKKGQVHDGRDFVREALDAGAVAIVSDLYNPFLPKQITQVICQDVGALEAHMATRFYEDPSHTLVMVGVTGTNGKTTSTYLIHHLAQVMGQEFGLIGTVEWRIRDRVLPSSSTTPDVLTLQKLLYEMRSAGCVGAVMEVSSHGLAQNRVQGVVFDIGLFTNLTQDHLDYHKTMEDYAKAKAKLFSFLRQEGKIKHKAAVINIDSPWASTMMQGVQVPLLLYGFSKEADLRASQESLSLQGSRCLVSFRGEEALLSTPLIGKFNLYNCLGALGIYLAMGYPLHSLVQALTHIPQVPGRLERVENSLKKNIFVDYAHTEDALHNVLTTLREVVKGKIFCVFGCGGDRDRTKRPKMGRVVELLADEVFVTSDNPRSESPQAILIDILAGIQHQERVHVYLDREEAIAQAVQLLGPDDVLLLAGKGHETYQIFAHQTVHFDDRIVAKKYC
ncbi:MAG: UDP-N-acetylmuramoyl-L-alanyl-D-glutamate--2,6-diaminopimelate ligase [Chlamydiae bacterium]|nr:UDP-N-acetylmuramoyl-L-alanyl-D-glutamate--2,6-diaminopimelate ligase [Chlamydiota bacterium]